MKILRFSAMWCSACLIMKSRFNKIEENIPQEIEIIDYDYDMNPEEVEKWNVGNVIPVFIFLDQNNQEIKRVCGEIEQKKLLEEITQYIKVVKNETN